MSRRAQQKLPEPHVVNRLYWFDELSQKQIAEMYGSSATSVFIYMKRHGIKARRRRIPAICQEPGCERPTCRVKRWFKSGAVFHWSRRCAIHFHENKRNYDREYKRKKQKWNGRDYTPRRDVVPGQLAIIAKDD